MPFRSESMSFCQLILPKDTIFQTLTKLGEIGLVQFVNMNEGRNVLSLPFTPQIHDLTEIVRQIQILSQECKLKGIKAPHYEPLYKYPSEKQINDIASEIGKFQLDIEELTVNLNILEKVFCNFRESKFVLEFCQSFFNSAGYADQVGPLHDSIEYQMKDFVKLEYLSGTVPVKRVFAFERMVWRVSKGNFFMSISELKIESYDSCGLVTPVEKYAFILFFQGEVLKTKIMKICEGFHCVLKPCPETEEYRQNMIDDVSTRIEDMIVIINKTEAQRNELLISASKRLYPCLVTVKRMKGIYYALNSMSLDHSNSFYISK